MICIHCGANNKDEAVYCYQCGAPLKSTTEGNGFSDNSSSSHEDEGFTDYFYTPSGSEDKSFTAYPNQKGEGVQPAKEPPLENTSGTANNNKPAASLDFEHLKSSVKDFTAKASETASKAASQAKSAASQVREKVDRSIDDSVSKEINEANSANKEKSGLVSDQYSGSNYMSSDELWTWLKKDSKRQQFFTEDISEETEEEYIDELKRKLVENRVPVTIEKRVISWDRSDAKEPLFVAVPQTKVVNPLTYLVQFSHVGKFTFVEEKTFITPPDLPPVPHNKIPYNGIKGIAIIYLFLTGFALLLGGSLFGDASAFFYLLGIVFIGLAVYSLMKVRKINEYNKKCDEELRLWNQAWDNWRTSIFLHSFQEDVNGQLSRIFEAVFSCINQINAEKFKDRKTLEVEDSCNMNELEQMISRKQAEYR